MMRLKNFSYQFIDAIKKNRSDFKKFTSVEKAYLYAQLLWVIAIVIFMTLTPLLVKATTDETALTGVVRAVYMWSLTATLLISGDVVKRFSMRATLMTVTLIKTMIFFIITIFLFWESLTFQFVIVFFVIFGIISAHSYILDIDSSGVNRVFSNADKKSQALYIFRLFDYFCLLALPVIFGFFVDHLEDYLGIDKALGVAFVFFCVTMMLSGYIYYKYFPTSQKTDGKISKISLPREIILKTPKRLWNTAKIVWGNYALRLRFGMVALEEFMNEALLMVVLPTFALDILKSGMTGNGLLMGAMNAGGVLAMFFLLSHGKKLQKKYGFYRYISVLAIFSCATFIPTLLFWTFPTLPMAMLAAFLVKFLYEPLRSRMDSLLQIEINSNSQAKPEEENIFSLLALIGCFGAGLGGLVFAFIFIHSSPDTFLYGVLGPYAPMKIVSAMFFIFCIVNALVIVWFRHYIYHEYKLDYITEKEEIAAFEHNVEMLHVHKYEKEIVHKKTSSNYPTVALLGPPTLDNLAIAHEGGQLSPGNVHLVFDPSWIVQELEYDGTHRLYLKRGLYFDREGDPILAEYKVPRLIHYYDNFYTSACAGNVGAINLEKKLDTPMGCDSRLEHFINESLIMRVGLSSHAINSPQTLAFLMPAHILIKDVEVVNQKSSSTKIYAYPLGHKNIRDFIAEKVMHFLKSYQGKEVVIKPSGAGFIPPYGVKFFSVTEVENIVDYVLLLEDDNQMTPQGSILIEERIHSPPLYFRMGEEDGSGRYCVVEKNIPLHILTSDEIKHATFEEKKEWVVHVMVARTPWNRCIVSGVIGRMSEFGFPLSRHAAVVPIETIIAAMRAQYGLVMKDEEVFEFEKEMNLLVTKVLAVIEEEEKKYPGSPDAALQPQIDFFGLDVMFVLEKNKFLMKVIAIRDHNVGKEYQFDAIYPGKSGAHSKMWIATMLARARKSTCRDKRLILVGAGSHTKKFYFDKLTELGIHVILVDNKKSWAKDLVAEFISIDDSDPHEVLQQVLEKLHRSINSFGPIDGITTFSDFNVVLTAEIARDLHLLFLDVANARTTKSKLKTRKSLAKEGLSAPRFFYVDDENTLDIVLRQIASASLTKGLPLFPMIMKPVFGVGPAFTKKVNNPEEVRAFYAEVKKTSEHAKSSAAFDHRGRFILEEFVSGSEFHVDMAIQRGKVKYASVTDNWSEGVEKFISPVRDSLPSAHLTYQEQRACIIQSVLALEFLGITDGIVHVKGKYDVQKKGAEILEINARPGDFYLTSWQKDVWGVDTVELLFAIALQIPVHVHKSPNPLIYLESYRFNADCEGILAEWVGVSEAEKCPGFKEFVSVVHVGDKVNTQAGNVDLIGYVVAQGDSKEEALANLNQIRGKISFKINPT